jgi:hypothetical protein
MRSLLQTARDAYSKVPTHHREYYRHHRELPVLHRAVVVYVRGPCTVERDHASSVYGAHEYVLRHKVALAPGKHLFSALQRAQCGMSAFAHAHEPVPVRVVAVLEPLVDQHVGRVVVERFAYEFAHG